MNPFDQALADLTAAEGLLAAADGTKQTNDSKVVAAQQAAAQSNQADIDAAVNYNAKAKVAIDAITTSLRVIPTATPVTAPVA